MPDIRLTKEAAIDLAQEPGTTFRRLLGELKEWDFTPGRHPVKMKNLTAPVFKFRLGSDPRVLVLLGKDQGVSTCLVSQIFPHDEAIKQSSHFGKIDIQSGDVWDPVDIDDASPNVDYDLWKSGLFTVHYDDGMVFDIDQIDLKPFLADDQIQALQAPGPLLLKGGAGSGKTLCLLERLLSCQDNGKKVYVTYDSRVAKEIELWATAINSNYKQIRFMSMHDFYKGLRIDFDVFRCLIYLDNFKPKWETYKTTAPAEIAWEEIQGVLTGV